MLLHSEPERTQPATHGGLVCGPILAESAVAPASMRDHGRTRRPASSSPRQRLVADIPPAANVAGVATLRQLRSYIAWRRLPLYALLGMATATAAFLAQAALDLVNRSMPSSYRWSPVGQFHFLVMWSEMTFLYLVLATAVNNWSRLRLDASGWRAFMCGWLGVALFAASLAIDLAR